MIRTCMWCTVGLTVQYRTGHAHGRNPTDAWGPAGRDATQPPGLLVVCSMSVCSLTRLKSKQPSSRRYRMIQ